MHKYANCHVVATVCSEQVRQLSGCSYGVFKYVNCHDVATLCNVEATVCYAQVRQLSRCDGVLRNRTAKCRSGC